MHLLPSHRIFLTAVALAAAVLAGCTPAALPPPTTYYSPYDAMQIFIEGMSAAERDIAVSKTHRVRAAIVPHHVVSTEAIAAGMRSLSEGRYRRIIVLSPDHFGACPTTLCTTRGTFETLFGNVQTNDEGVATLLASPLATTDAELFKREHGIFAVLPYVARYLPDTKIIPVVLSQKIGWVGKRDALRDIFASLMDDDTALVVSSDFSHYLPLIQAEDQDRATMVTFLAGDMDGIAQLKNPEQSDCPSCLWVLASLAKEHGFFNPSVLLHTNSAELLNDTTVAETTSHFAIAFYENHPLSGADPAFAGDVTITRGTGSSLSATMQSFWAGSGARMVNLEGPLREACPPMTHPYVFCNPMNQWRSLADMATDWSVRNNHMLDHGNEGQKETERLLRDAGENAITETPVMHDGLRLFAWSAIMNPVAGAQTYDANAALKRVRKALQTPFDGLTVVMIHDGTEYDALTSDLSARLYRSLIDDGADAVVVAHSHVPGDMEIYHEKPIIRGLGNFLFDQSDTVPTSTTKIVRLRKGSGAVLFETLSGRAGLLH